MKIIDTFVFLLITGKSMFLETVLLQTYEIEALQSSDSGASFGILSSAIALAYSPNEKGLLKSMLELNSAHESANFNTLDRGTESVVNLLKESCVRNSGLSAYNTAKKGWQDFLKCSDKVQLEKIQKTQFSDEEKALIYLGKYCDMVASEENCLKHLSDSIKPCMEPEERRRSNKPIHVSNLLLQFICNDGGDGFEQFIAHGGQKCMDLNKKALLDCCTEFASHYNPTARKSSSFTHPDANDCINVEEYQLCYVQVLNECVDHVPADIVNTWFNSIITEMGCENLVTSQASLSSIIDIVLITIAMAILTQL